MNYLDGFTKYFIAIGSFLIFKNLDEKYGVSKWLARVFKVNTMFKSFIFSFALFFVVIMLEGIVKITLGISDSALALVTWFTIGLIAALGSGAANLAGKK